MPCCRDLLHNLISVQPRPKIDEDMMIGFTGDLQERADAAEAALADSQAALADTQAAHAAALEELKALKNLQLRS